MAAVGILKKQRAVALGRIFGPDYDEVRREFHIAVLQNDRVGKIDDALVMDVSDRHCEIDASGNTFVGAALAKGLGIENIRARRDLDVSDAGTQVRDQGQKNQEQSEPTLDRNHAGEDSTGELLSWGRT